MPRTRYVVQTAIGIALYVVLSMVAKIPVISHISLDLGYIVLAVYCYHAGAISGAIVGGVGCVMVSLLTTGWFPPGWFVGNVLIGLLCGKAYLREDHKEITLYNSAAMAYNTGMTVISVMLGILVVKTIIECSLYGIPYGVKIPKNLIAAAMDSVVMAVGVFFARRKSIAKCFAHSVEVM